MILYRSYPLAENFDTIDDCEKAIVGYQTFIQKTAYFKIVFADNFRFRIICSRPLWESNDISVLYNKMKDYTDYIDNGQCEYHIKMEIK